jgi:hypothetical protein
MREKIINSDIRIWSSAHPSFWEALKYRNDLSYDISEIFQSSDEIPALFEFSPK